MKLFIRIIALSFLIISLGLLTLGCQTGKGKSSKDDKPIKNPNEAIANMEEHKITIYQVMTRLFGNTNTTNKYYGTIEENGVGKMNDFTDTALTAIKNMGFSHIWYTGVLEHALMTDYTEYGIPLDDADVIKGRAGSPYSIKDYYDINPDLATDVNNRMKEFEDLVERSHKNGLKVIIDFVPNHVARSYSSDAKPAGVKDFGSNDDVTKAFSPNNNFYYIPGEPLQVPKYDPLGKDETHPTEDGKFAENPAKVTGNDVFRSNPSVNDWFEAVKLNYGVDIKNRRATHFDPIPDTWFKMRDILKYWANKKVDGFRCDMAEMVPKEFWAWVIPQIKEVNPEIIFIAEIYNKMEYKNYIEIAKFDYLYDKIGLYDSLKLIMKGKADTDRLTYMWTGLPSIHSRMLYFLENHDEQRIASKFFLGNAMDAHPMMVMSATFSSGPVMMYFGQNVGEPALGAPGFSGDDGRTTIFDYWGVEEHQKWLNDGKCDGALLSDEQIKLNDFYKKVFNLTSTNDAIRRGEMYELHFANTQEQSNGYDNKMYSYLRYTENEKLLIFVNFNKDKSSSVKLKIPQEAFERMKLDSDAEYTITDLLNPKVGFDLKGSDATNLSSKFAGISMKVEPLTGYIFRIEKK